MTPLSNMKFAISSVLLLLLSSCNIEGGNTCERLIDGRDFAQATKECERLFQKNGALSALENWITSLSKSERFQDLDELIANSKGKEYEADALFLVADALHGSIDIEQLTSYYTQSAQLFVEDGRLDRQADALHQLFRIEWKRSNHRAALSHASESLSAARAGGDKGREIMALKNLFNIFEEVGSLGPAQLALSKIDQLLVDDTSSGNRINAYISQGLLEMNRERFGLAKHNFHKALTAASGSKNGGALRGLHLNIVHANIMLGKLADAKEHMDIAWGYANPDGSVQFALLFYQSLLNFHNRQYGEAYEVMQRALKDQDLPKVWVWEMHYWAGEAASKLGDTDTAIKSYRQSIEASESLRQDLGDDQLKAHMLSRKREAYEALFIALFDSGQIKEAFSVSEQAKTRGFVDAYVSATQVSVSGQSIAEISQRVSDRIDGLQAYLGAMSESPIVQDLDVELVINGLSEHRLISYFRAKQRFFIIDVNQGKLSVSESTIGVSSLQQLFMRYEENPNDLVILQQLGELLFPTKFFQQLEQHIFVSPDDFIGKIGVASLRVNGQFIVENASLSLVPSASALFKMYENDRGQAINDSEQNQHLLIGDPLGDLPAANEEILQLAEKTNSTVLIGKDATLSGLRQSDYDDTLHIASHAGVDHLGPWLTLADGKISGAELVAQIKVPRITVLASCASGVGQDRYLWGSLGGLFLSRGTSSAVVALWSIEDVPTQSFMKHYYNNFSSAKTAQALASTQRQAIRDNLAPRYWSAFTVLGLP